MENLADIPVRNDTRLSDQENIALKKYFGDSDENQNCRMTWTESLKISGYGVLLFGIFANPWINNVFYKIPYMANNPIMAFCVKMVIFAFAMFLIVKFSSRN